MNDDSQVGNEGANDANSEEVWPRKLNKIIIGVGVLAFGLIIGDRLISVLKVDDIPEADSGDIVRSVDTQPVDGTQTGSIAADAVSIEAVSVAQSEADNASDITDVSDDEAIPSGRLEQDLSIEDVFGGQLMFVSSATPMYVVTEHERRIDVGEQIDEQTVLSGLTTDQLILERAGNLIPIDLPEPTSQ